MEEAISNSIKELSIIIESEPELTQVRVHCTKFYSYGTYGKEKSKLKGIVNRNFFEKNTFYLCDFCLEFCRDRANLKIGF